jgi:hypothetical protein
MKTTQQQRVLHVLNRMAALAGSDNGYALMFSDILEDGLNDLVQEDAFGTEGQNDPRGDGRDGNWSMWCVQGVDDDGASGRID